MIEFLQLLFQCISNTEGKAQQITGILSNMEYLQPQVKQAQKVHGIWLSENCQLRGKVTIAVPEG